MDGASLPEVVHVVNVSDVTPKTPRPGGRERHSQGYIKRRRWTIRKKDITTRRRTLCLSHIQRRMKLLLVANSLSLSLSLVCLRRRSGSSANDLYHLLLAEASSSSPKRRRRRKHWRPLKTRKGRRRAALVVATKASFPETIIGSHATGTGRRRWRRRRPTKGASSFWLESQWEGVGVNQGQRAGER